MDLGVVRAGSVSDVRNGVRAGSVSDGRKHPSFTLPTRMTFNGGR
jgi:hypothetical protein